MQDARLQTDMENWPFMNNTWRNKWICVTNETFRDRFEGKTKENL